MIRASDRSARKAPDGGPSLTGDSSSPISAVARAMEILSALAESPGGLSVGELTARLGLSKSIVSRILTTLARDGYLVRDDAGQRYRISFKTAGLVHGFLDRGGFPAIAQPLLDRLALAAGHLVELWVLEGETLRCVALARSPSRQQLRSLLGQALPLHASGLGKAWLASMSAERAAAIVTRHGLPRLASRTITEPGPLAAELERTRARGYGTSIDEMTDGVSAVAVPVRGGDQRVVGGVTIAGPTSEVSDARLAEFALLLGAATEDVSAVWPRFDTVGGRPGAHPG
jgi:IclR family transcriptional regulator, acetate operon repressor